MQMAREAAGAYKGGGCGSHRITLPLDSPLDLAGHRPRRAANNMVKYFSVDWLAQSHRGGDATEAAPPCRPHVPCVVQPRPPAYGKGYLQPKLRASKPAEPAESSPCSPQHSADCASPVSEVGGYSSGYESEAASSECLSVGEGTEAERDAQQRRVRTKFSPEQISKLEKIFNKHKYLDAGERVKTAHKLNLTETQVRTWFQNRRMKLKREVQDYLAPQVPPVMFQPLPPVHYPGLAGQRPHFSPAGAAFYPIPVPQLLLPQQQQQQQQPPHDHHQHHPLRVMIHNHHFY